jgi:hypothetical protein
MNKECVEKIKHELMSEIEVTLRTALEKIKRSYDGGVAVMKCPRCGEDVACYIEQHEEGKIVYPKKCNCIEATKVSHTKVELEPVLGTTMGLLSSRSSRIDKKPGKIPVERKLQQNADMREITRRISGNFYKEEEEA